MRRRMATLADRSRRSPFAVRAAEQAIHERRLANAGRAKQHRGPPGNELRRERVDAITVTADTASDLDARRGERRLAQCADDRRCSRSDFVSTTTAVAPLSHASVRYRSSRRELRSPGSAVAMSATSTFAATTCASRHRRRPIFLTNALRRGTTNRTTAVPSPAPRVRCRPSRQPRADPHDRVDVVAQRDRQAPPTHRRSAAETAYRSRCSATTRAGNGAVRRIDFRSTSAAARNAAAQPASQPNEARCVVSFVVTVKAPGRSEHARDAPGLRGTDDRSPAAIGVNDHALSATRSALRGENDQGSATTRSNDPSSGREARGQTHNDGGTHRRLSKTGGDDGRARRAPPVAERKPGHGAGSSRLTRKPGRAERKDRGRQLPARSSATAASAIRLASLKNITPKNPPRRGCPREPREPPRPR